MRTNLLYLSMVGGLCAMLLTTIPTGISQKTDETTIQESRSVERPDVSSLQDRLGIGPGHVDDTVQNGGLTELADKMLIDRGMTVDALVTAYGEPAFRSDDGMLWSYNDKVIVINDEKVSGWVDHSIDIASHVLAAENVDFPRFGTSNPQFAGRVLTPFSTRATPTETRSSRNDEAYFEVTTRDRVRRARFDVRRRTLRTTTKPAWLRAFGESLDRSQASDNSSGVFRTGRANFRHVNFSKSGL